MGNHNTYKRAQEVIDVGGVAVLPTDTVYGIVAQAGNVRAVERIYEIRGRDAGKPCIILISDISQMRDLGCELDVQVKSVMKVLWDAKKSLKDKEGGIANLTGDTSIDFLVDAFSVIVPCTLSAYTHLHRGTNTLAFRMPLHKKELTTLIDYTGPIIAPSANVQGVPTPKLIEGVFKMFGENVDIYVKDENESMPAPQPSHVIEISEGKVIVVR